MTSVTVRPLVLTLAFAAFLLVAGSASAAPFYATSIAASSGAVLFGGSAIGAPDDNGLFFPDPDAPGFVTYAFSTSIGDGAGADIQVFDFGDGSPDPTETGNVLVSTNGVAFTFIASIIGGPGPTLVDIAGLFAGPVNFVRIENTFGAPDGDGLDLDTVAGLNAASVPEPATLSLLGAGLSALALGRRRRVKA